jgi:hypothetical protein
VPAFRREDRERAIRALQASADDNNGTPVWATVAREVGISRETLQRWWASPKIGPKLEVHGKLEQLPAPNRSPDPGPTLGMNPATASDSEFWAWRWSQVQMVLSATESDVARAQLMKSQDEIRRELRAAVEREAKMTATTREEVEAKVRAMIDTMPPTLAMVAAESLRRRGFA